MRAIQTIYNGVLFRSKLEAQWAAFFDKNRMPWLYEPEAFVLNGGLCYTPDFYFPDTDTWFEVKGFMDDFSRDKCIAFVQSMNKQLTIGDASGRVVSAVQEFSEGQEARWNLGDYIDRSLDTFLIETKCCKKKLFFNYDTSAWYCFQPHAENEDTYLNEISFIDIRLPQLRWTASDHKLHVVSC